jgi:hypothetical protein
MYSFKTCLSYLRSPSVSVVELREALFHTGSFYSQISEDVLHIAKRVIDINTCPIF